jgi:nucleoside diphosphate kinase
MKNEVVHVMLKPDTLERGLRDQIVEELEAVAGPVFIAKRMKLTLQQIAAIYSRFPNPHSRSFVFNYFTSRDTEHLAFLGGEDLHQRIHKMKGRTGSGAGIRGKYFSNYVHYTKADINEWLQGTSSRAEEIDVEMFGRDILHVADNQADSIRGLQAVMGPHFADILRAMSEYPDAQA